MHRLSLVALVTLVGCSSTSEPAPVTANDAATTVDAPASSGKVDVSGGAIYHSMNRLGTEKTGRTPEYKGLSIDLVALESLLSDPLAKPIVSAPLVSDGCPTMGMCPFSFAAVPLSSSTSGLVVRLSDTRTSDKVWVATATIGDDVQAFVAGLSSGKYAGGRAFAVSRDAIDTVMSPLAGVSGDELMARGFVFGLVYSTASTTTASGKPVVGATVTASSPKVKIVYPNNNFGGTSTATASQGAFLAIPEAVSALASVRFTITPPAGDTHVWPADRDAVVIPGTVFFMPIAPKP